MAGVIIVSGPIEKAGNVFYLVTMSTMKGMAISTSRKAFPQLKLGA